MLLKVGGRRDDGRNEMQWALPTARGHVVLKDGLAPWTTREPWRNVQEKQIPALPGLKSINQVLTGEVLGMVSPFSSEERDI